MNPSDILPQPPREAFEPEAVQTPSEPVAAPQEAAQAPQQPRKLNVTIAKQLDERVRVMQDRHEAFERELDSLGVDSNSIGLKRELYNASLIVETLMHETASLRHITAGVRETLESL